MLAGSRGELEGACGGKKGDDADGRSNRVRRWRLSTMVGRNLARCERTELVNSSARQHEWMERRLFLHPIPFFDFHGPRLVNSGLRHH